MDVPTPNATDALPHLQRTVQRKLGRCLFRLQQYEIQLKALVAHSDIVEAPNRLQSKRETQAECVRTKTLGTLVGKLTGSYLTSDQVDEGAEEDDVSGDGPWLRVRFQMQLSPERYEATKAALKELVDLRNELVHHFMERFNVFEVEGCLAADVYLDTSFETIDGHFHTLRGWAQAMEESRKQMAAFISTPTYMDFIVNGISPDGSVHWPWCGAVTCLREAEPRFEVDGWTNLNTATAWIRDQYPEQQPQRYSCSSWRQVIHESRQFEVRKQTNPQNGRGEVRSRQEVLAPFDGESLS